MYKQPLSTLNPRALRIFVLSLFMVAMGTALTACSGTRFRDNIPLVYTIDVQQGNVVTQEMLAKLRSGMDQKKVRFIMGTPLIIDTFNQGRWDYVYTNQIRGGRVTQRRISLHFQDGLLDHVDGDVNAALGPIAVEKRTSQTVDVPGEVWPGLISLIKGGIGLGDDTEQQVADDQIEIQETLQQTETDGSSPGFWGRLLGKDGDDDESQQASSEDIVAEDEPLAEEEPVAAEEDAESAGFWQRALEREKINDELDPTFDDPIDDSTPWGL